MSAELFSLSVVVLAGLIWAVVAGLLIGITGKDADSDDIGPIIFWPMTLAAIILFGPWILMGHLSWRLGHALRALPAYLKNRRLSQWDNRDMEDE